MSNNYKTVRHAKIGTLKSYVTYHINQEFDLSKWFWDKNTLFTGVYFISTILCGDHYETRQLDLGSGIKQGIHDKFITNCKSLKGKKANM